MDERVLALSVHDYRTQTPKAQAAPIGHVAEREENVERGNWSSKTDYLLSMIGCAVGLGNVWRFPYLAYRNGGGAFLIPYTLMLAFAGMPVFFLESAFGQFASCGCIAVWKAVPMLQGVGITMMIVVSFCNLTYNCIIAYSLYYLFVSFQSPLPWADCFSWWGADETCSRTPRDPLCNLTLDNGYSEIVNTTWLQRNNRTCSNGSEIYVPHQSPSEQYWDKGVLHRSSLMDEMGNIVWHLALSLLLAWLIIGAALSKGIKSSGKVVYFTAIFPYVVLTILLIRGLTLEGAHKGIEFYIGSQTDFSKLADTEKMKKTTTVKTTQAGTESRPTVAKEPRAQVWKDAATQIFYSLAVGWGSLITLSSYNKFHNNCYRDTITVCVVNCSTSVFAGFAIFSILGHMAHVQNKPVSEVAQSEVITTTLVDQFPKLLQSKRLYLTAGLCLIFYLLGLIFVTEGGVYWLNLIDYFCTGWILITIALLELIGLSWVYGVNRFIKDIEMMIGERNFLFWLWWRVCWCFISPCMLLAILTWSLATFAPPSYGPMEYPVWATPFGWFLIILCIMWIPVIAIMRVAQAEGSTLSQKVAAACSSAPDWGPYLEQHRGERYRNKPGSAEVPNQMQLLTTRR
ncbi:sodium- and chloride-dependent neutral and basic amino acid transporter B(0+)-like isoform X5 [Hypanus sabinus]|uniref:sodium- and chloride-dependent neutral and basic amino acid transporter B(0+)-like isoform X5 n=1 Tax=Hypanus sabinus TaxID=79690 RepID=UPI0028C5107C|nr:sodium- and chloride-dependent neutral and basic amino acid transporter B(0+)-like isoform X5 [Hypanus sabinus]